jgi:hypothetical protein
MSQYMLFSIERISIFPACKCRLQVPKLNSQTLIFIYYIDSVRFHLNRETCSYIFCSILTYSFFTPSKTPHTFIILDTYCRTKRMMRLVKINRLLINFERKGTKYSVHISSVSNVWNVQLLACEFKILQNLNWCLLHLMCIISLAWIHRCVLFENLVTW